MVQNRVWIPEGLETEVATILHLGHKCVDRMFKVASGMCYWAGKTQMLKDTMTECQYCQEYANLPATPSPEPSYLGEMISINVGQQQALPGHC